MQVITPKQWFTLVATALSGLVVVVSVLAFGFGDGPVSRNADGASGTPKKFTGRLRPSQPPDVDIIAAPAPRPAVRPGPAPRFAFIPPEIGILNSPPGDIGSTADVLPAADPGTWAVDVRERPAPPQTARSEPASVQEPANRRRKPRPGHYTLGERLAEIAPGAKARLAERFGAAKVAWPPEEVALVAIKDERTLELHARSKSGKWIFIHRYKVLAASGRGGPKLSRGDRQVPEGIYRITYLNPNSRYHVSLRVNYPNQFDRKMASKDGRKDLGGDIMIHGKRTSAGCLAMGDPAAEELFVLVAEVGKEKTRLIIAPTDFRRSKPAADPNAPDWLSGLYTEVATAMADFKRPQSPSLLSLLGL